MTDPINQLLELAIQIQQIPAPTFEEGRRAAFVQDKFMQEGLTDVSQDALGNVYARVPGGAGLPLVACAHLDTVFPMQADLQVRREPDKIYGPGLGDNSMGVASLFGLLWNLRAKKVQLPGDLWLVADVGEEGLGDLRGMRAVVERFGSQVRAYLLLEGLALGHVYHRAIGVQRYRVTIRTTGGHSWSDFGKPSAIHELAALVTKLTQLKLPAQPRTTLNVGTISGGTTVNTISSDATLDLDLRSEKQETLTGLIAEVEGLFAATQREGVAIETEVISRRPPGEIRSDHPLIQLAQECVREQGLDPQLTAGSTDANIPFSQGFPAVVLGVTTGGGAHTKNEFINVPPIKQGMAQLVSFVSKVWE